VVIDDEDQEVHHGLRMTTPGRTLADLLRQRDYPDVRAIRRFVAVTGVSRDDVLTVLNRRGHLADKRRALFRLNTLFGGP
jgi:hypothetical protein